MTLPSPAVLLRHRAPALLLDAIESFAGGTLACRSPARAAWRWPEVLEGTAQCAGLLAGLQPGGPGDRAVIAEYRGIRLHGVPGAGIVRFSARLDRRLLDFWRCLVEAHTGDGTLVLEGRVTLAPGTP